MTRTDRAAASRHPAQEKQQRMARIESAWVAGTYRVDPVRLAQAIITAGTCAMAADEPPTR